MAFSIALEVAREFEADASASAAFALLRDVPASAAHFPTLDELYELGPGLYLWELTPIGLERYTLRTSYACRYTSNAKTRTVKWAPIPEEGNTRVSGEWRIKSLRSGGSRIHFRTAVETDVPLPQLARFIVAPLLERAFARMIDTYIENLCGTFTELAAGARAGTK